MFGQYFYHEHTRRAVSVFGTLFNDINIIKRDGSNKILSSSKVPLSYGPRQKFLARINQEANLEDPKLAIKLPRMSFEITDISYDESTRLTRGTQYKIPGSSNQSTRTMFYPSTYRLSFELSILSKHTDDALQILEQILPFFQPEYTVTVNEVDNNFKSDMPFTLTGVSMSDDYEGDFLSRRSIIYTLTFETRVRYFGPLDGESSVIREAKTNLSDVDMTRSGEPFSSQNLTISPSNANEADDFSVNVSFDPKVYESAVLTYDTAPSGTFKSDESVIGQTSGAAAVISEITDQSVTVVIPDGKFEFGETIIGSESGASFVVTDIEPIWNTLS
jgi:hypothetical protein